MQKLFFIASNAAYFEYMMIRTSSVIRFQEFRGYKMWICLHMLINTSTLRCELIFQK